MQIQINQTAVNNLITQVSETDKNKMDSDRNSDLKQIKRKYRGNSNEKLPQKFNSSLNRYKRVFEPIKKSTEIIA